MSETINFYRNSLNIILLLIFLMSLSLPAVMSQQNFTGHRLYSIFISSEEGRQLVSKQIERNEIDLWTVPVAVNANVDVRVPPEVASQFEEEWRDKGITFNITSYNIQRWIDWERKANPPDDAFAGSQPNFKLNVYHTHDAISSYIDTMAVRYDSIASVENIGTTFEGNSIKGLKVGSKRLNKPAIWINSGFHAREWVAPATSLFIIDKLIKGYDTDPVIQELVDHFDWYIFPVINVDGYKYSWTTNRLWRKDRDVSVSKPSCVGIDPNKGFGSVGGAADNPCSETYPGPQPFSDGESRAIRDGVLRIGSRLKAFFTLVSYSQLWIPFTDNKNNADDYEDQMKALQVAINAVHGVNGKWYRPYILNITTLSSAGWAYKVANVKYSYEMKLRDTGRRGFILCNSQIVPTAEENFAGIKAIADIIRQEES